MAIFGSKDSKSNGSVSSATIITNGSHIEGNLKGNDSVHVDGRVDGDIVVNNIVVIGKSGNVSGNIKAQKVICSGIVDGFIECEDIEIMQGSSVGYKIISKVVIVNSEFKGEIVCDKILIDELGVVSNKIQAREVIVKGEFNGDVACETLTTKPTGRLKGNMFVNNILNEGGKVEGAIGQYKDLFAKEPELLESSSDSVDVEVEDK